MPERASPLRGEVWLISFDPSVGGEVQKTRPAVVVSNDAANITVGGRRRKAMADQITTVSVMRLRRRIGRLGGDDVEAVVNAVRLQLGM